MQTPDTRTNVSLEARVAELERSLGEARRATIRARRTTTVLGGALLLAATVAAVGPQRVLDVVQASRFEIVDDEGRVVASLIAGDRGGQLDLWDDSGRNILRAAGNRHGADLALWSAEGESVAGIYATSTGGRLTMHGTDGTTVARLDSTGDGGHLRLADGAGAVAASIAVDVDGGTVDLGAAGDHATARLRGNAGGGSLTLGTATGTAVMVVADIDRAMVRVGADDALAGISAGTGAAMMNADLADGTGVRIRTTSMTGPVVQLGQGHGPSVQLSNDDGCGRLELNGPDGHRARLGASHGLQLSGHGGAEIASLINDAGRGRMLLHDSDGHLAAGLDAGGENWPSAIHLDHRGRRIFAVAAVPSGGLLNLMNRDGRSVFAAGVADTVGSNGAAGGGIAILNGTGTPIVTAGVADDGGGHVSVFSADATLMRVLNPPTRPQSARGDAPSLAR